MAARKNINTGDKFGMLTVLCETEPNITPCGTIQRKFECQCDCGNIVVRSMSTLLHTMADKANCGCSGFSIGDYKRKYQPNEIKHFLYSTWSGIKQRCYDKNSTNYASYGGRGITMCDEWRKDYLSFKEWSEAHGARKGLTIDRIDNNGNYCPENCRWVDIITQANNTRANRIIEYNGIKHTVMEWSRLTGVNEGTIRSRIDKHGCTVGQALGYEEYNASPEHILEYNGESHNITEWSIITGVNKGTISSRLRYGYSVGQALGFEEYKRSQPPRYITYQGETHNLTEWERITGVNRHAISSRLSKGASIVQALGFDVYKRKASSYVPVTKKVLEYDLDGNFIKEWDSAMCAAKHYGASAVAIRYACNGVTHSSCNRIWKYKEG